MSVLLRRSNAVPVTSQYRFWLAVTGTSPLVNLGLKLPNLEERLEDAFIEEQKTWWQLGNALSKDTNGALAHMPTAGSFGSDFGIMLAWGRLVKELAYEKNVILVVCDDPWLFHHLAEIEGVESGVKPALIWKTLYYNLRGFFVRARIALRNALAALTLSSSRKIFASGETALLVYGHPSSNINGYDAYFGDLMARCRSLKRLLHTDCLVKRASELAKDSRTMSLHAWGNPWFALSLLLCRWRPPEHYLSGPNGWLIKRAAIIENSGGGPAMNFWQAHCQEQWLNIARPSCIVWPWENHGWERNLCRVASRLNIKTIGYQHTVIGPHQFNYAIYSNHDGLKSIPDVVVADGPAYLNEMVAWGIPESRLVIGGAFRFPRFSDDLYDLNGPVFVPLSAVFEVAFSQLEIARVLASKGQRVLVKPHPMYPVSFDESDNLVCAKLPLAEQRGLSAVLYSTGASGLEAILMGIPGYRLTLDDRIAIDVLPRGITTLSVTIKNAAAAILEVRASHSIVLWEEIFSDPDIELWKSLLFSDIDSPNKIHMEN